MKLLTWTRIAFAFATTVYAQERQEASPAPTFIESERVTATFAKGGPLLETGAFKVHASRRDSPGVAEVHARDTDIIYVLEGSATLVTGGTALDPKTIGPDEIRGKEIKGGQARRISKGDVIVVPNGVAHWFKQVDGSLIYYVVKVTSPGEVAKWPISQPLAHTN